ncbi:phosphatidylinositol 4,5-bisphosphate 3-kinase catalytic subunit beta isoform [Strongylocentrotus purpuratus]|uniref:Phosphatidylinositol-4,5-bisphosphate 3-kinase n=1 Tax=Strongylocentrotus purpuratus TaxID=7668 RepID=A0A7M7P1G8_STRPU|nr:phosphatidylinositol 4,5-bisphosphate 3-kinase catalytic subunit beta isoform [Strongylocentrotus purpuratus]XP_030842484.1 phosphatidylinositol 4,5-bisphosphate 3-kinase catalytic subunit beta isoform [Strongylocentrotus purpuratus]
MAPGSVPNLDQWSEGDLHANVELMCLLPNGIYIPLQCSREATLTNIKRELWTKAKSEPLFNLLLDLNFYIFQCINYSAEQEELLDEKRRLCDIKPFWSTLRVVRKAGDVEDRVLNSQIGLCIGKSLHEYDMMKNQEVHDFRSNMKRMCMSVQKAHMKWPWDKKAMYLFPPEVDLAAPNNLPENLLINMRFSSSLSTTSVLQVKSMEKAEDLVEKAQKKMSMYQQNTQPEEYVLKIRSYEDFLLGGHPLSKYKYIRKAVKKGQKPELILIHKSELKVEDRFKDPMFNVLAQKEEQAPPLPSKAGRYVSWDIEEKVRVTFHLAKNVNVIEKSGVRLKAGVFHGDEELCPFFTSKEVEGPDPKWQETYEADINVSNLPRMAKLCIMVYTLGNKKIVKTTSGAQLDQGKAKKKFPRKDLVPIAWVNLTFFDYRSQLRSGPHKLFMWPASEDIDLNPLGHCESNPSKDDTTCIEVSFEQYRQGSVSYPTFDKVIERAADIARSDDNPFETPSEQALEELRQIVEKDPLEPLSEQEREDLWLARQDCRDQLPHALPRLLKCVHWNHRDEVAQMQALLQIWPPLKPEESMELLDYRYPDVSVRQFAVKCLQQLTDDQLSQYLLQLVQALKYETHLDCAIGKFLLDRALSNQRIGHFLFWHLRAEMHQSAVCTRFGLMLEAYCRGSMAHIKTLSKQVESLNKMKNLNELIKSKQAKQQDKGEIRDMMQKVLQQDSYADTLSNFVSPLAPSNKLKCLRLNKCKFMSSKMRPLWLVFENDDPIGDDVYILFKNGDDLRQDMLTLQVMQIMDNIWQEEGLDLRIIPYKTLATGPKVGLIEVVTNSDTIANIQKQHGSVNVLTAAFQKAALFEWLKKHSPTEEMLNKAIEDFTFSCAGYCVATYVLGIGDRHNDNIMVKESGQLFHIDFGHFLGNYKRKFGLKRERVPFVLTHDFVHVITRGKGASTTTEFDSFRRCCEEAFMILRRRGNLLINLFAMMLSSGIPELSDETIKYLRDVLVLDRSEDDALRFFQGKFNEALKNSWKTSLDWMMHHIAHRD